jgi:hypothetical protein
MNAAPTVDMYYQVIPREEIERRLKLVYDFSSQFRTNFVQFRKLQYRLGITGNEKRTGRILASFGIKRVQEKNVGKIQGLMSFLHCMPPELPNAPDLSHLFPEPFRSNYLKMKETLNE